MSLCLEIMEDNVRFAESQWHPSNFSAPTTGYFGTGDGQKGPHSSSRACEIYATLLTEQTAKQYFSKDSIARDTILNHCISALRWLGYTHTSDTAHPTYLCTDGIKWGADVTQFTLSWAAADMALAGYKLRDILDSETKQLIQPVVIYEANHAMTISLGRTSDLLSMQLMILTAAANFYPTHANASSWNYRAQQVALHAFRNLGLDKVDTTLVDGKPYKDWIDSNSKSSFHPDYTLEHHAYFNPHYLKLIGDDCAYAAAMYRMAGNPVPEAFLKNHLHDVWEECLGPISTWEGFWGAPQGRENFEARGDYNANHSFNAAVATMLGDPYATAVQSRTLQFVRGRQKMHGTGQLFESGYIDTFKWAWRIGYIMHKYWPADNSKSYPDFLENVKGVRYLPMHGMFVHRTPDKYVAFSWGAQANKNGLNGLIIPQAESHLDDPVLVDNPFHNQTAEKNIIGSTKLIGKNRNASTDSFNWEVEDDYFSTSGLIKESDGNIQHYLSFTSFPNRVCINLEELKSVSNVTVDYSIRAPLVFKDPATCDYVGNRTIFYSTGSTNFVSTSLTGNWWNISDRLGCAIDSGRGIRLYPFTDPSVVDGYWLASSYVSTDFSVSSGQTFEDIATVYFPDTDRQKTQSLSTSLRRLDSQLPTGWSGLVCLSPEGQRNFALANFYSGTTSATLSLSYSEGAPVLKENTSITDTTGSVTIQLNSLNSKGETLAFYIDTNSVTNPIIAKQLTDTAIQLTNSSGVAVSLVLRYLSRDTTNIVIVRDGNDNFISSTTLSDSQLRTTGISLTLNGGMIRRVYINNNREID
ncbi:MAG: hypothetical protein QME64_05890, partial [bacterium]|nr:hypothetical protein [bacterium]